MVSFYEFLTEAVKKPTFKSTIKDIYSTASLVKGFNITQKIIFTTANSREYAKFELTKKDFANYKGDFSDLDAMHTWRLDTRATAQKNLNGFLTLFGCPKSSMNNIQNVSTNRSHEMLKVQFKDSNGFDWIVQADIMTSLYGYASLSIDVEIYGNAMTKQGEESFAEYPAFVPGAILWAQVSYTMTRNFYYIIESRDKKTIYCREIGSKVVDGDAQGYGHEVPNPHEKHSQLYKAVLRGDSVKIDGNRAVIWNGNPNYFNSLD